MQKYRKRNIIIVLGKRLTPEGAPDLEYKACLLQGVMLCNRECAHMLIISGGKTRKGLPSEAQAGKSYLNPPKGSPLEGKLHLEETSRSTPENYARIKQSFQILPRDVLTFVTSAAHAARARLILKRVWPEVYERSTFITVSSGPHEWIRELLVLLPLAYINPKEQRIIRWLKKMACSL